jgi:hypothetical protein
MRVLMLVLMRCALVASLLLSRVSSSNVVSWLDCFSGVARAKTTCEQH